MSRPVVVEGAAAAGGSANPVAATPGGAGGAETASPSNNNAGNTSSVPQRSIRKYAQWTEDMEECLMSQVKGRQQVLRRACVVFLTCTYAFWRACAQQIMVDFRRLLVS